jgi:nitrite reductase/ring-hydroxylating ferredoxin subunit
MKNIKKFNKILLLLSFFLLQPAGCVEEPPETVPDVPVNITIDLNQYAIAPASSFIITNQMVASLSLGYNNNGIIIYRDLTEFYAYDRTCPHHIEKSTAVILSSNPLLAECPECHSYYNLQADGLPTEKSSSKYPLKKYHTVYYPVNNALQVNN